MATLKGKTLFISGGTRGIGEAIVLNAAKEGANIILAAKTAEPHPSLPGTIHTVAKAIEEAGGKALPIQTDIREDAQIEQAVAQGVEAFGGIDIVVNNASAINLAGIRHTPMKRFDLMNQINVRGTYAVSQACIPHLLKSDNPHIITLSPPINMDPVWFKDFGPYTMSKYGMSLCMLTMAEELRKKGIASNALWPATIIATAAIAGTGVDTDAARTPQIMADAAIALMKRNAKECTANFFIDETLLKEEGVTDFEQYAVKPGTELFPDLFLS